MSQEVRKLEPTILWNNFEDLNAIPRPSKKEERVRAFLRAFAEKHKIECIEDSIGNIILKKPASKGMENRKTVILQAHMDMVHQKNSDVTFDFDKEGIRTRIDSGWVKAQGTTLGADNGIGVAAILSVMQSDTIAHGPLEALITVDEETGMSGAFQLKPGILKGSVLMNLDSEEDNELCVGCAGGIEINVSVKYKEEALPAGSKSFKLSLKGLKGGHSGVDIHLGRGNANKIMNRLLYDASEQFQLQIASIEGGSLRNAIPRESFVMVVLPAKNEEAFKNYLPVFEKEIRSEFRMEDKLSIIADDSEAPAAVMNSKSQSDLLHAIYACPNNVLAMSIDIPGLVETSNNLAKINVGKGEISIQCLARSNGEAGKNELARSIQSTFELMGATVKFQGSYPGWKPDMSSPILVVAKNNYKNLFKEEPKVMAIHAGLECGIIGKAYPGLDMISFGPTIKHPHSPDEKVDIASVQKFWAFLQDMLKNVPVQ
ncbi:MAG: aminoacyl-histidine dipeptidase [Bacteroidetes bacterium]|nr:aminoacyl-histidine dipeptidase [Bacteroidota bacterium]